MGKIASRAGHSVGDPSSARAYLEQNIYRENKKTMNKSFYFLFMFLFPLNSFSQELDTSYMMLKAKICLLEYSEVRSKADVVAFFDTSIPFNFLNSKGFSKNLYFIEIPIGFDATSNHKFLYDFKFIIAYNSKSQIIYRLKGFQKNEFKDIFDSSYFTINLNFSEAGPNDLSSRKEFIQAFSVEGLDMNCLYKTIKNKTKHPACLQQARQLLN